MKHEPMAVARQKMDTPVGLFSGACSCGWRSDGLNNEAGALKDARQHADASTANENRTVTREISSPPVPAMAPDEVTLAAGGAGWMGSFTRIVVGFLEDLLSDGEPVEVGLMVEDEGASRGPYVLINGRLTAIESERVGGPYVLRFADRFEVDAYAVLRVTV